MCLLVIYPVVYVHCRSAYMYVCVTVSGLLELELQTAVSCHRVLGIQSWSSESIASVLNH